MSGAPQANRTDQISPHGKASRKYLERYAEAEARSSGDLPPGSFGHAVVIPVYGEGPELHKTLRSIPCGPLGDTLVVLVLNARADAPPEKHAANARVLQRFPGRRLHEIPGGCLWLIDRAGEGRHLPEKQGVGLARKIGCDVAFALWMQGRLKSRFIHWTDADAIVPSDYLESLQILEGDAENATGVAAAVHTFEHVSDDDPKAGLAIRLYESFLRYYVLGLRHAGSPYAFHSIGSTIAIDAAAYARVRGVPRVMAGEDFYCLDKLAKVGGVRQLAGNPILLSGRVSDRVPFGTGRAMTELMAGTVRTAEYRLPDPAVFEALRIWIHLLKAVAADPGLGDEATARQWLVDRSPSGAEALTRAVEITGGFALLAEAIREPADAAHRLRRLHTAFDGFRTLKLLHALRDLAFPPLPFLDAIEAAEWISAQPRPESTEIQAVESVRRRLIELERDPSPATCNDSLQTPGRVRSVAR